MVWRFRDTLKNRFPLAYKVARRISIFLRITSADGVSENYDQYVQRTIYYRNIPLMGEAFNNEYFVHHGPFSDMKYIQESSGSALLPKIIGSYEEPIQRWIEEIITGNKYKTILNVGCAEGYYAVGFALNMPNVEIIASDINESAREKVKKMMEINDARNITIKAECSTEELNSVSQRGALVFCDIEGAEKKLLDPARVPNLSLVDILVESHDNVEPGITDLLVDRFYKTHAIEIAVDYPSRMKKYNTPNLVSSVDYDEIINEHRAEAMRWLYMKSLP